MKFRSGVAGPIALVLALLLAGCVGVLMNGPEGSAPPVDAQDPRFNAADEMFVTGMIPHHEQALEMAEIVLGKEGVDERVAGIAERIQAAQQPEIDLMTSWLEEWGVDPDMGDMGDMAGMDHGDDGMMSDDDMAALEAASGEEASALFLEQMIEHHEGAIEMSQQELDNGSNAEALELARQIIDAQTAEIAEMQELLAVL
jgi:uncharacterized protein (DUF305 family)